MAIGILSRPMQRVPEEAPAESLAVSAREATSIGAPAKRRMWEQLVRECEAMVQHALGTGRVVPADVMARLDRAVSAPDVPKAVAAPDRRDDARGERRSRQRLGDGDILVCFARHGACRARPRHRTGDPRSDAPDGR